MRVAHHRLHPDQAASAQRVQELGPERLSLRLADIETDDLAHALLGHAVGDDERLLADAALVADAFDLRVQPLVRISAIERPVAERLDLFVEAGPHPGDLVLREARKAHLLDQPIDLAGRDAVDVGLLNDGHQGLLVPLSRLEERR